MKFRISKKILNVIRNSKIHIISHPSDSTMELFLSYSPDQFFDHMGIYPHTKGSKSTTS